MIKNCGCRYSEWIDECERVNNPEEDGAKNLEDDDEEEAYENV